MATDLNTAVGFYGTRQGAVTTRLICDRLQRMWPSMAGRSVLGIGYCGPYLNLWREQSARCVVLSPAQIGLVAWPESGQGLSCSAEEDTLPFPDLCFDRVLVVHGLEAAENARRLLREVWRVLKDDGRLLVVAANRRGMWAHVENTPFGQGQPYSPGQVGRLLGGKSVPARAAGDRAVHATARRSGGAAQCGFLGSDRPAHRPALRRRDAERGEQKFVRGDPGGRRGPAAGSGATRATGRGGVTPLCWVLFGMPHPRAAACGDTAVAAKAATFRTARASRRSRRGRGAGASERPERHSQARLDPGDLVVDACTPGTFSTATRIASRTRRP